MKIFILSSTFLILWLSGISQNQASDFVIIPVEKKVKDFPDKFDLSSPVKSEVTISYMLIKGKEGYWGKVSSAKYRYVFPDTTAPDSYVPDSEKETYLNTLIKEYITYKDSIACTISLFSKTYYIRWFYLEKGVWVNGGEDKKGSLQDAENLFKLYAHTKMLLLRSLIAIDAPPLSDSQVFINDLKSNGNDPLEFLLRKLESYKLVIFGEIHNRIPSWDLCTRLINESQFAKTTGTIFMEFESNQQEKIDQFLTADTINRELLLNIFRDYMIVGWDDALSFNFLISIWHLNKKLPDTKKIRVVFVDTPRIFTEDGIKNDTLNRDIYMSNKILEYLNMTNDTRHSLFIVGTGHVFRSEETAGAFLYRHMQGNMYSIFTHSPVMDNSKQIPERIRKGVFDFAFYENGDKPVAFDLKNSPFGNEPFDGLYQLGSGSFKDNYDGYIFFGSLDTEKNPPIFSEIYDEKFVQEMNRRYKLLGWDLVKRLELNDLSVESVLQSFNKEYTPLKWSYLKPLDITKNFNSR